MSVPVGYKATEVGVIPEDWEAKPLSSLKPFITSGSRGWAKYYAETGDAFVRITNLSRQNIYPDLADLRRVKLPEGENEGTRTGLRNGDVLVSITADIGIIGFVDDRVPKPAYINQHIATVRVDQSEANSKFLSYFLATEGSQRRVRATTDAGAKAGMSLTGVGNLLAAFPPTVTEQAAIAEALSDVDEAIAAQEAVIAKKRALKTATMQALLSATRRLPGFSAEWERRSFDQLFQFLRNGSASRAALSANGAIGYIHYGDIHAAQRPHMDCGKGALPRIARETVSGLPRVQDGDLLIADASEDYDGTGKSVEAANIGDDEVVAGLHTLLLRPVEKMAPGFAGYLQFIPEVKRQYVAAAQGVSVYGLSRSAVKSVEVAIPEYDEQAAISSCLIDIEIDVSHQQDTLQKLRNLKTGMMQQLLTGKIRLV